MNAGSPWASPCKAASPSSTSSTSTSPHKSLAGRFSDREAVRQVVHCVGLTNPIIFSSTSPASDAPHKPSRDWRVIQFVLCAPVLCVHLCCACTCAVRAPVLCVHLCCACTCAVRAPVLCVHLCCTCLRRTAAQCHLWCTLYI
jgi:hypothetical protein